LVPAELFNSIINDNCVHISISSGSMKRTAILIGAAFVLGLATTGCESSTQPNYSDKDSAGTPKKGDAAAAGASAAPAFDTAQYNHLLQYMANGDTTGRWPVKHSPIPKAGAILPFYRPIAYYGNLYSNRMGALGKWPKKEMMQRLMQEVKEWNEADTVIKSIPTLHYIAVTAQGAPGKDGMWRTRMPHHQIDTILNWAKEIDALVFIDVQIGLSSLEKEIPLFEKYLSLPNVHLGIDPEFAMARKGNKKPGSVIGSVDAEDINWVSNYLVDIIKKNNLPPKMFMIHRFTKGMVTNYQNIKLHPELQIVMDMDGWGPPELKKGTYRHWIHEQPVQYTGFKLFYVNDTEKSGQKEMMTKQQVLSLKPKPVYIQYQ
jgi:hypothetical protein